MKTSSIAEAKSHLSQLIHQLEVDEAIYLTRHGKPVAVLVSELHYQKLTQSSPGLFHAIQSWRSQLGSDVAFDDNELKTMRQNALSRDFTWDE